MRTTLSSRLTLVHLMSWLAFVFYEVSMALVLNPDNVVWVDYIIAYLINISLFYFHAHVVMAHALQQRPRPLLLLLLIPLELALYTFIEYGFDHFLSLFRASASQVSVDTYFVLKYIWRGVYFIGLSTAYWLYLHTIAKNKKINQLQVQRFMAEQEKSELEKNLFRSQNAFLQAQINPHLLFNTLNFIYNHVQEVSGKAAQSVLLLSEIMHYALNKVQEDGKAELSREVEHVKNYVALNQLRFEYPLYLETQYSGRFSQHRIPPLVLLTFIENTFQHGDLTDPAHPAAIHIISRDHQLNFQAANKKRKHPTRRGHGIGIRNVETRLRDFYGDHGFRLRIREDELHYFVNLTIDFVP